MSYFSGKCGGITIGGSSYPIKMWELTSKNEPVDVSNFLIGVQEAFIPSLVGGEIRCEGFYTDTYGVPTNGNVGTQVMPTAGSYATFALQIAPGVGFTVTALINEINVSTEIKGAAQFTVSATITPVIATC